ncbi:hypothetical protein CKO_01103 [Citrobacter koseri ATCC BAA-895]|uniref:Uncharacterized protein n=1 Tax=Citrobacter koseri (strain ATCC BAA-895 / CDC 4225-83 / SGSC4696) TaxID=290338 RepID=A8AFI3_CITK8|nr:hypothetical protein CKO_01103 [Citrobacter koseri ATCC BAA-895]
MCRAAVYFQYDEEAGELSVCFPVALRLPGPRSQAGRIRRSRHPA